MVAVGGHLLPLLRQLLGELRVLLRASALSPRHVGQLAVRRQGHDGLDREVGVVGQMAGEVVGAELVLRVESLLLQVFRPLRQGGPVAFANFGVALGGGDAPPRMSMFPHSSTGMSSPLSVLPVATGYVPTSWAAKGLVHLPLSR